MDRETIVEFTKVAKEYLEEVKSEHPFVKKVLDSQEEFKVSFAEWRNARIGATPWPYETIIEESRVSECMTE
jgi:TRAP-type mannitol/chloroaromatic compound transport system substrate-binding protein